MSRVVDLTKPLEDQTMDDLRYIHDRGLVPIEDQEKIGRFITKMDSLPEDERLDPLRPISDQMGEQDDDEDPGDEVDDEEKEEETEDNLYNPSDHDVKEVNAYLSGDITEGERARVLAAEADGQARKGILGS